MSSAVSEPDPERVPGVPCPREVWRAAADHGRIAITVQTDSRAATPQVGEPEGEDRRGGVTIRGEIRERRKVGDPHNTYVSVVFVPDGELAPVEIEASKDRGEWGEFRAFSHQSRTDIRGDMDHCFQFIGAVTGLDIPGGRWNAARGDAEAGPEPEVAD